MARTMTSAQVKVAEKRKSSGNAAPAAGASAAEGSDNTALSFAIEGACNRVSDKSSFPTCVLVGGAEHS